MNQAVEKLDVKTEAYKIKIEEAAIRGTEEIFFAKGKSTLTFQRTSFKEVLLYLLEKDEKLFEIDDTEKANLLLNIRFIHGKDIQNRNEKVIKYLQEIYDFKISRKDRFIHYFNLQLLDSLQLKKHQNILLDTTKGYNAKFNLTKENLVLENANTDMLINHRIRRLSPMVIVPYL